MRTSLISAVLASVLLAGCAATPSASAPAADAAFPLTVNRRGGFAGVEETARITADGAAVVTHQGQSPVQTSLPPDTISEIRRILSAPGFPSRGTPSAGTVCNDGFEYEVISPSASTVMQSCDAPNDAPLVALVATVFQT